MTSPAERRVVVLMAGTTGSGKTRVAEAICRRLPAWRHVESDRVRKELAQLSPWARADGRDVLGGIYAPEFTRATYAEMASSARACLAQGRSVVLDGSFRRRVDRARVRAAAPPEVAVAIISCHCGRDEQLHRLTARYAGVSISDGRPEVLSVHERDWEVVAPDEAELVLDLDTSGPWPDLERRLGLPGGVLDALESLAASRPLGPVGRMEEPSCQPT